MFWSSWFGFFTLCFTFLSPFLGWAADLTYNPNRNAPPIWPDILHHYLGRLSVLFAYVTIILGMLLYGLPNGVIVIFGILIGSYFVVLFYLEIYRLRNSSDRAQHKTTNL